MKKEENFSLPFKKSFQESRRHEDKKDAFWKKTFKANDILGTLLPTGCSMHISQKRIDFPKCNFINVLVFWSHSVSVRDGILKGEGGGKIFFPMGEKRVEKKKIFHNTNRDRNTKRRQYFKKTYQAALQKKEKESKMFSYLFLFSTWHFSYAIFLSSPKRHLFIRLGKVKKKQVCDIVFFSPSTDKRQMQRSGKGKKEAISRKMETFLCNDLEDKSRLNTE